ncbi:MAG: LamG-like jellyroll fold domain-containing protein [archaeon]
MRLFYETLLVSLFLFSLSFSAINLNFVPPTPPNGTSGCLPGIKTNISISTTSNLDYFSYTFDDISYPFYDDSLLLALNFENRSDLGENDTFVVDISKSSNNVTLYNGVQYSSGYHGKGLLFDGVNDYASTLNNISFSGNSPRSVEFWARVNGSTGNDQYLVLVGDNCYTGYEGHTFGIAVSNSSQTWFVWGCGPYDWNTGISVEYGVWHHHVVTYDGSLLKWYVDGNLAASISRSLDTRMSPLSIGYNHITNSHYFNGSIDEVRIYNRALSEDEVKQHYLANLQKYNNEEWNFYIHQIPQPNQHNFSAFANNSAGESNTTETRMVTTTCIPLISCGDITESGAYTLARDIRVLHPGSGGPCFLVSANNTVFIGNNFSLIAGADFEGGIRFDNVNNITISGFNFIGFDSGVDSFYGSSSIHVENNTFRDCRMGISLSGAGDSLIQNNTFENISDYPLYLMGTSAVIRNNTFFGNLRGIYAYGIFNTLIENNTFQNIPNAAAIELSECHHNNVSNNRIFSTNGGIAIVGCANNTFKNNEIGNVSSYAISIGPIFFEGGQIISFNNTFINQKVWDSSLTKEVTLSFFHSNMSGSFNEGLSIKSVNYSQLPNDPSDYYNIGKYVDITFTGESIWLFLNISYNESELGNVSESTLSLWKYNGTEWFNCSQFASSCGVDTNNNIVYANITDFGSIFAPLGQEDTTPPDIISGPNISTTSTSANISWITSEPSNYTISISDGSTSWTISNSTFDSSHLVTILDLSPNTTYYYNITIWDQAGNNNTYSNYNFTTNPSEQPGGQAEVVVTSAPEDSTQVAALILLVLLIFSYLSIKERF